MAEIAHWDIKAIDGRNVKVDYTSHGLGSGRACPHLEFNGTAVSETGYLSHFFGDFGGEVLPDLKEVYKLAIQIIKERYLPPQQVGLF